MEGRVVLAVMMAFALTTSENSCGRAANLQPRSASLDTQVASADSRAPREIKRYGARRQSMRALKQLA